MAKIERNGDHYELDGERLYFEQPLTWIAPDGHGRMPVVFKLAADGKPQLWTFNMTLMQQAQERFRLTGRVPLVDETMTLMRDDPLQANLEWMR